MKEASSRDISFLNRHSGLFEDRICPACASNVFSKFCEKSGFTFVQCGGCLSIFMNPAPNAGLLEKFYEQCENYKVWASFVYPLTRESRWETLHKRRSQTIRRAINDFLPGHQSQRSTAINYLEIGAGTGDTADRFRRDSADLNV